MPLRPPVFELILTHVAVAAGLFSARAAYGSGDPSGLQYIFLPVATVFVVIAALLTLFIRLQGLRVPRSTALLIGGALLVTGFPYILGLVWDSGRIDPVGYWAATLLLGVQLLIAVSSVYRALGSAA